MRIEFRNIDERAEIIGERADGRTRATSIVGARPVICSRAAQPGV
jgi:hypothetical protein